MRLHRQHLDEDSVARLLQGAVHPDDAPPGYGPVAELLNSAARLPQVPVDDDGSGATISAMVEAIRAAPPSSQATPARSPLLRRLLAGKALAAVAVLGLTATGAAAATGSLPDGVQGAVAGVAGHVGLDLPHPDHGKSAGHRQDTEHRQDGQQGPSDEPGDSGQGNGQGEVISGITHDPALAGQPKGPTVCAEASSDGRCRAGGEDQPKGGPRDDGDDDSPEPNSGPPENPSRGGGTGEDLPPTPPSTAGSETGAANSGRDVGASGKDKARSGE